MKVKLLYLFLIYLCLNSFAACEKALVEDDDTEATDTTRDDEDDSDGKDDGDSDEKDDKEKDAPGNSDSGSTGDDKDSTSTFVVDGEKAQTVYDFCNKTVTQQRWVVGYIVGDCTKSISNANFTAPFTQHQALLLADDPDERDTSKMMSVALSGDSRKAKFSLKAHPENQGKRLFAVYGYATTYLGIPGMSAKTIGAMRWYGE